MSNKLMTACLFGVITVILTGCWDSIDIENRANVLAMSIDLAHSGEPEHTKHITSLKEGYEEEGQELLILTAQVAVPGRIPLGPETTNGGGDGPVWVVTSTGKTLNDALLKMQLLIAETLFLGHLHVIVVSEDFARSGLDQLNDFLRREAEVRRTAWKVVSKEKASTYMKVAPELERIPALYLHSMIENTVELGKFPDSFLGLFWRRMSSEGEDGYLPYLQIVNEDNIQIKGLAYFDHKKMVGILQPVEIGLFMAIVGDEEGGYGFFVEVPELDEEVLLITNRRKSKIKTKINGEQPEMEIKIRIEVDLHESNHEVLTIDSDQVLKEIEQQCSVITEQKANEIINKMKEERVDIFGFGEYFRAKQSKFWRNEVANEDGWRDHFEKLNVDVSFHCHIRKVGLKAE